MTPNAKMGLGVLAALVVLYLLVIKPNQDAAALLAAGATTAVVPVVDTNTGVVTPAVVPVIPAPAAYPSPWKCNAGIDVPLRRENNANKDISCMSLNAKDCLWGSCATKLAQYKNDPNLKPLACGAGHQAAWGSPGYNNPAHWCYKGNNMVPKV